MPEAIENISDVLASPRASRNDREKAYREIVERARNAYESRITYRQERKENRDYFRGKQWEALIRNDKGQMVKEKDYIADQNRIALTMNLVGNIVNNVHGQFMENRSERAIFAASAADDQMVQGMNLARRATRRVNSSNVIEADNAREHFLSGASAFKSTIQWRPEYNRHEVTDHIVDQTRFFYNTDVQDRRLVGLNIIGEMHDVTRNQLIHQFATSQADVRRIDEIIGRNEHISGSPWLQEYNFDLFDSTSFHRPRTTNLVRVIEAWTLVYDWIRFGFDPLFEFTNGYEELTIAENEISRIQNDRRSRGLPMLELGERRYEPHWHRFFLSPEGDLYKRGASPFTHGEHCYTLGLAIHVDGETWGIVNNIRDPQRWLNRMISQIDHSMGAGAKGALGLDEDVVADSTMTREEIIDNYSRADGTVELALGNKTWEQAIRQLQSTPLQSGHFQLIPLLMAFVEKISGISEAAQGFAPHAGTPAALYERQVVQAAVNALPYLKSYFEAIHEKDRKELKLLLQTIIEPREVSDKKPGAEAITLDPQRLVDIDFDVEIAEADDTRTHREQQELWLLNLVQAGAIPPEVYLALSQNPMAQPALQMLQQLAASAVQSADNQPSTENTNGTV